MSLDLYKIKVKYSIKEGKNIYSEVILYDIPDFMNENDVDIHTGEIHGDTLLKMSQLLIAGFDNNVIRKITSIKVIKANNYEQFCSLLIQERERRNNIEKNSFNPKYLNDVRDVRKLCKPKKKIKPIKTFVKKDDDKN